MDRIILSNLNPNDIIHPEDARVISWANKIPYFERLLSKVGELYATTAHVTYAGNGYKITENSIPQLYSQFKRDCEILGINDNPDLSVDWGYFISSLSVGTERFRIVLTSGAVDLLEPEELDFLIGHELGHILCGHMPYHMLIELLYSPIPIEGDFVGIVNTVKLPMLEWYRISHYSADRIGLLVCQDINAALRTMIKMSGLPKKCYDNIDVDSFIEQANQFENTSMADNIIKSFCVQFANSPWMVLRAKKLLEWYNSDEYKKLVGKC